MFHCQWTQPSVHAIEPNGCESIRMLNPLCDYEISTHLWPWIFKVKFWNNYILGMEGQLTWTSIGCCAHNVTLNYDLDLGFSRSDFEIAVYIRNERADWHGMCVHRRLGWLCDVELCPHPWPWPCFFEVEITISGMGRDERGMSR